MVRREKKLAHFWARREPVCAICPFFYEKYFLRRLVFELSITAKKAPKAARVGFRSCSSALATLVPLSTRARDPERDGANRPPTLVPFSAHSPPTHRGSWFMPRGTTPAHPTTNAAVLPTPRPLPSMLPKRTHMGDTVSISFSLVSGEPSDWNSGGEGTGGYEGAGSWPGTRPPGWFIAAGAGCWCVLSWTPVKFCCATYWGGTNLMLFRNKFCGASFRVG